MYGILKFNLECCRMYPKCLGLSHPLGQLLPPVKKTRFCKEKYQEINQQSSAAECNIDF